MGAVTRAMVGWEDEELGDTKSGWKFGDLELRQRECDVLDDWSFGTISLVHPVSVGCSISDDGV
jgi:hypothetical protein